MRIPAVNRWIGVATIVICGVISATVARFVTEKRMDAVYKEQRLSMEREARIWLEWMQAVESGEPPSLSWLYTQGGLVLMTYQKQADRESWAQNPALQERIKKYREFRKQNPGRMAVGLQKLGSGPWLPETTKTSQP